MLYIWSYVHDIVQVSPTRYEIVSLETERPRRAGKHELMYKHASYHKFEGMRVMLYTRREFSELKITRSELAYMLGEMYRGSK